MTKRIGLVAAMTLLAFAGIVGPASARWNGDGNWHNDARWHGNERWHGNYYRPPPVVYGTPYNYGYRAPPVIYGGEPGINLNLHL
jgi:hypothetical protein